IVSRGFKEDQRVSDQSCKKLERLCVSSEDRPELLRALAQQFCTGYTFPWQRMFSKPLPRVSLPTYVFAKEKHWIDSSNTKRRDIADKKNAPYASNRPINSISSEDHHIAIIGREGVFPKSKDVNDL